MAAPPLKSTIAYRQLGLRTLFSSDGITIHPIARPHPRLGTFPLRIRVRGLDASPTDLLALIARHSRFYLLLHED